MQSANAKEISCRVTRTLLMYVRENNGGVLGNLLDGLELDEAYLSDVNNWVSHHFLQTLYRRMIDQQRDENAVYHMALASERFGSLGILDRIVRLLGNPRLIYSQAPKYNKLLKLNGSVIIREIGDSWVLLEDRYHDSSQKTRYDCDYTRGILAGIPTMFGLPLADVEEVECQVGPETYGRRSWHDQPTQGAPGCLYRVRWALKNRPPLWRRLLRQKRYYRQAIEDLQSANELIQNRYDEAKRLASDLKEANRMLTEQKKQLEARAAELVLSERKYRLLADNASDIIWVWNLHARKFDYISPSVERGRGFTPEEARELTLEQTLSERSLARVTEILKEELARDNEKEVNPRRSRTIELEQSLKSGGYGWAEAIVSFLRDSQDRPISVMGFTRDIDDRRRAEAALAESEKKYRNLFQNGTDLLCIHDLEGNILETNLAYKKQYGWSNEDLVAVNIRDAMPERYKREFDRYLERVIKQGSDEGYLRAYSKTGDEVVLEYRNRLIYDDSGSPKAVQGAARDVTERIRAERKLKESEEKYRQLVQFAPAGIYEMELRELKFTSVNDVMCEYTGYTEEEFLRMNPSDLLTDESNKLWENRMREVLSVGQSPGPVEYKIKGKDSREFWVLLNGNFIFENGIPKKCMVVAHDLTEIRQAQEEKRKLEIQLQNAQKLESLGTLAGGVAHDLNNILSGIINYPELLLLDLEQNSPMRDPLLRIKESGERAAEIVQDLLTLARRGVGKKRVVSLTQIVGNFLKSPEYNKIVEGRDNLQVEIRLAEDVLNVAGSDVHISKSLMNLMANAADAMPSGGKMIVSASNRYIDHPYNGFEVVPEGEYVTLSVADVGIGMPQSDLHRIFEPFYTKKAMGRSGSGLGMSVVWGTVKDHEGFIDITTERGQRDRVCSLLSRDASRQGHIRIRSHR